jgi:dihydroorotate dehydrogenase (NAD+) catalytic subunit
MPPIDLAPDNPYGLPLRTPVLTAAGCFGSGIEYERIVPIERLGAIVTGSISLRGRHALPPLRLIETPAGVLSVGMWRDPGLERVLREYAPVWSTWKTTGHSQRRSRSQRCGCGTRRRRRDRRTGDHLR